MDIEEYKTYALINKAFNVLSVATLEVTQFVYKLQVDPDISPMYSDDLIRIQNDGNVHASAMATERDYEGNLVNIMWPFIVWSIVPITFLFLAVWVCCYKYQSDKRKKKGYVPIVFNNGVRYDGVIGADLNGNIDSYKYFHTNNCLQIFNCFFCEDRTTDPCILMVEFLCSFFGLILIGLFTIVTIYAYLSDFNSKLGITKLVGTSERFIGIDWLNREEIGIGRDFPFSVYVNNETHIYSNGTHETLDTTAIDLNWRSDTIIPSSPLDFLKILSVPIKITLGPLIDNNTIIRIPLLSIVWRRNDNNSLVTRHSYNITINYGDDDDGAIDTTIFAFKKVLDTCFYRDAFDDYQYSCRILEWGTDIVKVVNMPSFDIHFDPISNTSINTTSIDMKFVGDGTTIITFSKITQYGAVILALLSLIFLPFAILSALDKCFFGLKIIQSTPLRNTPKPIVIEEQHNGGSKHVNRLRSRKPVKITVKEE